MKKVLFIAISAGLLAAAVFFALPSIQANSKPARTVTFSKDVAPIFNKNCAECHRPGEAAPFSTLSYKDVRPWAKSIKEKVAKREMPPWHADPHVGQWANDRRMTTADIDTIVAWVDSGAKEGDPKDMPPAPKFAEGWTIGPPDKVFHMPEAFTLKPGTPDEIRYFEVDPKLSEDVYVQKAEARPNNREIVHHIIVFVKPPSTRNAPPMNEEQRRKMQEWMEKESIFSEANHLTKVKPDAPVYDDGCATPSGGGGFRRDGGGEDFDNSTLLAGYAPGMNQAMWPAGAVKKIPAGSKLIFQLHYSTFLNPKGELKDRSSVGLVLTKNPEKELKTHGIANHYFRIPAGVETHRATACWTAKEDLHIVTFMPHLHMRGKAMKFEAFYPDGKSEVLCNVPNYDFNWQIVYYTRKPVAIPKGTKIVVTTVWDNSTKNKFNPDPKKDIRWGDPTYEEMTIGWIDYTVDAKSLKTPASAGSSGEGAK
jgi:mono/diheme cytochrome c family protein